jgi:crotonobetainyl-CoA:carnitine CoA-transferase CaiB-like acyl-CoA transferase
VLTGEPGGAPVKSGLSLVDYAAGLTAALGIVAAVHGARRTGRGGDVDTSLYDTALALLTYPATWWLSAGVRTERLPMSAHPSIVPFQFFRTADGHIAVACAKEHFWERLVAELGDEEIASDPRFARFDGRAVHRGLLLSKLEDHFAKRTTSEWLARLRGKVPCAPVRSMEQALDPAELEERGMAVRYDHPELGVVHTVGSPLRLSGFEPEYRAGSGLGADRGALLRELGVTEDEERELELAGAFGRL